MRCKEELPGLQADEGMGCWFVLSNWRLEYYIKCGFILRNECTPISGSLLGHFNLSNTQFFIIEMDIINIYKQAVAN